MYLHSYTQTSYILEEAGESCGKRPFDREEDYCPAVDAALAIDMRAGNTRKGARICLGARTRRGALERALFLKLTSMIKRIITVTRGNAEAAVRRPAFSRAPWLPRVLRTRMRAAPPPPALSKHEQGDSAPSPYDDDRWIAEFQFRAPALKTVFLASRP